MAKMRTGKIPSGWCITDYHNGCPVNFDHGRCSCSCHRGVTPKLSKESKPFESFDTSKLPDYTEVVKPSRTTVKDSTPKRRGRPPGSKNKKTKQNSGENKRPIVMSTPIVEKKSGLASLIKTMS